MTHNLLHKRINLIPEELRLRQRYPINKIISNCILLSLIASGLIYLYQITNIERYKNKIAAYQMVKGKLENEKTDLENALLFLNEISVKETGIEKIAKAKVKIFEQGIIFSDKLKILTQALPPTLWLNHVSVKDEELKSKEKPKIIKGMILKGESLGSNGITELLKNLEDSGVFSEVSLEYGEKKKLGNNTVFDFEIRAQMKR